MMKTFKITIAGQVQGVGFRPYIYQLAHTHNLTGSVSNDEEGVIIKVSGEPEDVRFFYEHLIKNPPKVSKISSHAMCEIDYCPYEGFNIVPSTKSDKLNLQLTPDFAICDDCKAELLDTSNRRFNYPFITCVNCGPRWGITNTFPFERDHTNMTYFDMCQPCSSEYTDANDRRFHSQTNSCKDCGVEIVLKDNHGALLEDISSETLKKTAQLIKEGKIIAIKNASGFLLCCDANNTKAIQELRKRKHRPQKPFALLYPSLRILKEDLEVSDAHETLLASVERPIVIISSRNYSGSLALDDIAPKLKQLGVMLPYTGMLVMLMQEINQPIIATSGNLHGSPILQDNEDAMSKLNMVADVFLIHNLKITNAQDDSVVRFTGKHKQNIVLRRSRGYAPNFLGFKYDGTSKILATGGQLKSTIAWLPNDYLYVSQYLGHLENFEVYERYTETISKFITMFEVQPDIILVDKHPLYNSSQYGAELSVKFNTELIKIQHHKAHFASVLGEHALFDSKEPILGVIWDGTGYGDDAAIWGGEFFTYHNSTIMRSGHVDYFNWLASDKMPKEPRLSLLSLASKSLQPILEEKFTEEELKIYQNLKDNNSLKTSSVGRLFDAVASLLGLCDYNSFEGEAAMIMESQVDSYNLQDCTCYINLDKSGTISGSQLIETIHHDLNSGINGTQIIANFHFTLASLIIQMAEQHKITHIACSGGVFQNAILVDMLIDLSKNKYKLYFNRNLSPNDENISFGQIMYYLYINN